MIILKCKNCGSMFDMSNWGKLDMNEYGVHLRGEGSFYCPSCGSVDTEKISSIYTIKDNKIIWDHRPIESYHDALYMFDDFCDDFCILFGFFIGQCVDNRVCIDTEDMKGELLEWCSAYNTHLQEYC